MQITNVSIIFHCRDIKKNAIFFTKRTLILTFVEINYLEIQFKFLYEIAKETRRCDESRRSFTFSPRKMKGSWDLKTSTLRVIRVRKTILHKSVYWFEIQRSGRKERVTRRCCGVAGWIEEKLRRAKAGREAEKSGVIKRAVNEARIWAKEATATVTECYGLLRFQGVDKIGEEGGGGE